MTGRMTPRRAPSRPRPAVEPRGQSPAEASAQSEYARGVRARVAKNWPAAVDAFHRATALRAAFQEAWNELGYALSVSVRVR
jgi:hypothetical protein